MLDLRVKGSLRSPLLRVLVRQFLSVCMIHAINFEVSHFPGTLMSQWMQGQGTDPAPRSMAWTQKPCLCVSDRHAFGLVQRQSWYYQGEYEVQPICLSIRQQPKRCGAGCQVSRLVQFPANKEFIFPSSVSRVVLLSKLQTQEVSGRGFLPFPGAPRFLIPFLSKAQGSIIAQQFIFLFQMME